MAQDDIQGQVVDPSGNPVSGAIVELTKSFESSPDTRGDVFRTTTDSNGNYIFTGHQEGDGTTQEWHVSCYNHDGTAYVNSFNNPGVTADLPSNAIPDSEDLQARYSAKGLSTTSSLGAWGDETDNKNDLTGDNNNPAVVSGLNGHPVVEFDNSNNESMSNTSISLSQPYTIYLLASPTITGNNNIVYGSTSGFAQMRYQDADDDVDLFNGQKFDSGLDIGAGSFTALGGVHDGAASFVRVDGQDATGDAGTDNPTGFRVASNENFSVFCSINFAEILVYNQDKRSIAADVESYWQLEWGYSVS